MVTIDPTEVPASASKATGPDKFYFAAWRWHFYAGLYVIPFLLMLATTGLIMLWVSVLDGRDGEWIPVTPAGAPLAVSAQADAALAAVPDGQLIKYIAPRRPELAAVFRIDAGDGATMVAVNPYTAEVLETRPWQAGWYDLANDIHGTLLLGVTGDRMIEIAASLGMVLIASGLYLWWPRNGQGLRVLLPNLAARGRSLWKTLHATLGAWISIVLVLFLVSGLSWAGVWGEKLVQAWSTFPAEKYSAPPSDVTHASMNLGNSKEVPWALEQTPMPASGSEAGANGLAGDTPPTLDTVVAFARQIGFDGRFQLNLPKGETGVWTISRDSMSNDSAHPTDDRTVHIDRYSGKILADIRYADYSPYGKAMAVGIALHEGDMGWWNVTLNTLFCLSVIFVSLSGAVMWWMRRPTKAGRLAAPPMPRDLPLWQGAMLVGLAVSLAFPMAGITILGMLLLDVLLLSRLPALRRMLS
ncbi:PepSY-associated TM helix domain-containing protein [Frigidibacter sp. ROC022]|uniref:PepSY-associated TM helix domain-containing protein n=1 Tax=Frigidibacter sp. ROC022 TaxID=2971796 RepID=UPI00215AA6D3|nr:PepSY domain-containing protein [Frigidibacter sp. ROC022]MCR8726633.1 PepSY domain-containing protein [Frigidibacter sp. ROC022]